MTFIDVLAENLQKLHGAEKDQERTLRTLGDAAAHEELRRALEEHIEETREQARRLEMILEEIGTKADNIVPQAVEGLAADALKAIGQDADNEVIDLQVIASAQRTEHFEIACYQTAARAAEALGMERAAQLLNQTLREEKASSRKLDRLAEPLLKIAVERELSEVEAEDE